MDILKDIRDILIKNKDAEHMLKIVVDWSGVTVYIDYDPEKDFEEKCVISIRYDTLDEFENVLHELINWMHDHEQGISIYDDILNIFNFFPDCGCERTRW